MSLRSRVAVAAGGTASLCLLLVMTVIFLLDRQDLRRSVDRELTARAGVVATALGSARDLEEALRPGPLQIQSDYVQLLRADGTALPVSSREPALPATPRSTEVAQGDRGRLFQDQDVDGVHVRVLTVPTPGGALQVGRPVEGLDLHLGHVLGFLAALLVLGIAVAALAGRLVAATVLRPVRTLADETERVTTPWVAGRQLEVATDTDSDLRRLGTTVNALLRARDEALQSQQRLVADAAHELLTPLTSTRTNLQILARADGSGEADRAGLLADVDAELQDLTALVRDLLELASVPDQHVDPEPLALDQLVEECAEWFRRRHQGRYVGLDLEPVVVDGVRSQLAHLVGNLLENAAQWSPPGVPVQVRLREDHLAVRDHGPGFAEADLPRVFERLYRSGTAPASGGSGIGLAIVRRVAEQHGWTVCASNAVPHGAELRVNFSSPDLTFVSPPVQP